MSCSILKLLQDVIFLLLHQAHWATAPQRCWTPQPERYSLCNMLHSPQFALLARLQIPHHGFAADVWSFGVLAYICLSGCHPLDLSGEDEDTVVAHRTRTGDVIPMKGVHWECVSEQARTFMCGARVWHWICD